MFRGPASAPGEHVLESAEPPCLKPSRPIGKIQTIVGSLTVSRAGTALAHLGVGDFVYEADVIETGADSTVCIHFSDGTVFELSACTRMVLSEFACDGASSNSALFGLVKGAIAFMAGRVAKGGGLSIDTPVARIRGSRGGGIAGLTLAALTFALLDEVRADDQPVIDDDELELPHGTFVLETKEKVPRIIVVDDPLKTVVLRKVGSTVEADQVTNSSDRMDELEKASRDTFAIYRLGQQDPFIQHQQHAALGGGETRSDFSNVSIASSASSSTPDLNPSSFVPLSIVPVATNSTALPDYQPPILVPVLAPVQVPHLSGVMLAIDSGSSSSDSITNIGTLVVSGVQAGAAVQYSIDGGATWTSSFSPVEGANTVLVRQANSAGNVSAAVAFNFILDTVAPGAPTIASVKENPVINASEASDGTPVVVDLTGTGAMVGNKLTIHWGGQTVEYTLQASDITSLSATVTVPAATITAQGDGTFNVTAQLTDAAGNVSSPSPVVLLTVDTTAPSAPTVHDLVNASNSTYDAGFTVDAAAAVTVQVNGNAVTLSDYFAMSSAGGIDTYTAKPGAFDGSESVVVSATQTDAAGNTSAAGTLTLNHPIDTTAPSAPTVHDLVNASNSTYDAGFTVDAAAAVTVQVNGNAVTLSDYFAMSSAGGIDTYTAKPGAFDGSESVVVSATQTDAAGNTSAAGTLTLNHPIDTTAPSAPTVHDLVNASNSTYDAGFTVDAAAAVTVQVNGNAVTLSDYFAMSSAGGIDTYTAKPGAFDGSESVVVSATQTDAAGNTSAAGTLTLNHPIDTTAPSAPTVHDLVNASNSTYDAGFTVDAAAAVTVQVNGNAVTLSDYFAMSSAGGIDTYTAKPGAFDGSESVVVSATQTDAAGNTSAAGTLTLNHPIDTTAPSAPTVHDLVNASNSTYDAGFTVDAAAAVTVQVNGNAVTLSDYFAMSSAGGIDTYTAKPGAFDGSESVVVSATQTDAAGNTSAAGTLTLNHPIDTTAPSAPTVHDLVNASNSTYDAGFTVDAAAAVTVQVNGNAVTLSDYFAMSSAGGIDTYTAKPGAFDGSESVVVSATQTDAAGNTSAAGTLTLNHPIDTTAPSAPTVHDLVNASNSTYDAGFTVDAAAAVTVQVNGNAVTLSDYFAMSSAGGIDTYTAKPGAFDGSESVVVSATQTDAAGNTSAAGTLTLNHPIDTTAPSAPTVHDLVNASNSTYDAGFTVDAAAAVTVQVNGNAVTLSDYFAMSSAGGIDTYTAKPGAFDGSESVVVSATQTDAAGNTSAAGTLTLNHPIDTTAPSAPTVHDLVNASNSTYDAGFTVDAAAAVTVQVNGNAVTLSDYFAMSSAGGIDTYTAKPGAFDGSESVVVSATQTDAAGNTSAAGTLTLNHPIDTTAPSAPTVHDLVNASNSTYDAGFTVDAAAAVTVQVNGNAVTLSDYFAMSSAGGIDTYTAKPGAFDGSESVVVSATQTDAAGNTSAAGTLTLNHPIDTTAPSAPTVHDLVNASNSTYDAGFTVDAAAAVTVQVNGNAVTLSDYFAMSSAGGIDTYTAKPGAFDGSESVVVSATQTDAAGNTSAAGTLTLNHPIDTIAPSAPMVVSLTDDAGPVTGTFFMSGVVTDDATPLLTITSAHGSIVQVYDQSGHLLGSAIESSTPGTFTFNPTLEEGTYTLAATATDAAGNQSADSIIFTFTVNTSADPNDHDDRAQYSSIKDSGAFVYGTAGNDTYPAPEKASSQTIYTGAGNDTISAGNQDDTVYGGSGNDMIYGNNSSDVLYGGSGIDIIFGGAQTDYLIGGYGGDKLSGGQAKDYFVYLSVKDSYGGYTNGSPNFDTIAQFNDSGVLTDADFHSGLDQIDLTAFGQGAFTTFRSSSLASATSPVAAHTITWYYDQANYQAIVYANPTDDALNGGSSALLEIHIYVGPDPYHSFSLSAGDFLTANTRAPAGAAGEPINLGLAAALTDDGPVFTTTIAGAPSGWTVNGGTLLDDGTWAVQTTDPGSLTITSPSNFAGAVVLNVTETWTQADGSSATITLADNVEVYPVGSPIIALSGDDYLTGSSGRDLFVFAQPIGNDIIYSFDANQDQIDLIGYAGFASFDDVKSHLTTNANGDAVIALADGQSITLDGIAADSLSASNSVFDQTPVMDNAGAMTIGDGALLPLSGAIDNTGTIALDSAGHATTLELIQHGITLQGGGHLILSDSDANLISGAAPGVTFTNADNTISGAGQLGDWQMTLVNNGTIAATGAHALIIDTGSNVVINTGTIKSTGSGGLIVNSDVSNAGLLWAHGGDITVNGSVSGAGGALITGDATLEFAAAASINVTFVGADDFGTLVLDNPAAYTGQIFGFAGTSLENSDIIDLKGITFDVGTSWTYHDNIGFNTGGILTVDDTANGVTMAVDSITFGDGEYTTANFILTSDGNGGTLIADPAEDHVTTAIDGGQTADVGGHTGSTHITDAEQALPSTLDGNAGKIAAFALDFVSDQFDFEHMDTNNGVANSQPSHWLTHADLPAPSDGSPAKLGNDSLGGLPENLGIHMAGNSDCLGNHASGSFVFNSTFSQNGTGGLETAQIIAQFDQTVVQTVSDVLADAAHASPETIGPAAESVTIAGSEHHKLLTDFLLHG